MPHQLQKSHIITSSMDVVATFYLLVNDHIGDNMDLYGVILDLILAQFNE